MPIKPENKARYPKDWNAIRRRILERAEHACEFCGVANYSYGFRAGDGSFVPLQNEDEAFATGRLPPDTKLIKIVLTIAHLDHTPEHNDPANLKALCQRCHLRYDREHHKETAAATRRAKVDQGVFNAGN